MGLEVNAMTWKEVLWYGVVVAIVVVVTVLAAIRH